MNKIALIFLGIILLSCAKQDCPEGINLLPMYGNLKKCDKHIKIDNEFLAAADKQFKSRKEAAQYYINEAWEYFYKNDFDTSMKRFNQAWLLDETNAEIYWGFGNLMGRKQHYEQSISLLKKAIKIDPTNSKIYENISISYGQLFFNTKKEEYLDLTIKNLKKAIKLDPKNARIYGQLTTAYSYSTQKDSLRKYLKITENLDPDMVHPEVRKIAVE